MSILSTLCLFTGVRWIGSSDSFINLFLEFDVSNEFSFIQFWFDDECCEVWLLLLLFPSSSQISMTCDENWPLFLLRLLRWLGGLGGVFVLLVEIEVVAIVTGIGVEEVVVVVVVIVAFVILKGSKGLIF